MRGASHLAELEDLRELWARVRVQMGESTTERVWRRWSYLKERPEL